jgi:hypothetical protein
MYLVVGTAGQYIEGKVTWRKGFPRKSFQRVPVRRSAATALLHEAKQTESAGTPTTIHFIQHGTIDEQPACTNGCGVKQNAKLSRTRCKCMMGKLPTRRGTITPGPSGGAKYGVLRVWKTRTLCKRLQQETIKSGKSSTR